jgi:dihydroflavonol-4-reductase
VQGIISARDHGTIGQIYILSGELVHVVDIWRMVKELMDIKGYIIQIPTKLAFFAAQFSEMYYALGKSKPRFTKYSLETLNSNGVINNIKARDALDYHPRALYETIRDTVHWWQEKKQLSRRK